MPKVVNLTVHKNTRDERLFREVAATMRRHVAIVNRNKGTAGYVLVAWDGSGKAEIGWHNKAEVIDAEALPDYVRREIVKAMG